MYYNNIHFYLNSINICSCCTVLGMPSIKIKINSTFPLPSLLESDDSELEDLLDDILERGRTLTKKHSTIPRVPLGIASK